MRRILLILLMLEGFGAFGLFSQDIKTDTLRVSGNCEMCKSRIERAAYRKGVVSAKWSADSQSLVVRYKPQKVSLGSIRESIVGVGHDVEGHKAPEEVYEKLPLCCHYRDEK